MKATKITCAFFLLAAALTLTGIEATAQRLGPTVYGFGTGAPGPALLPRTLETEPLALGTSPWLTLSHGNPGALALLAYGAEPRFSPMQLFGAEVWINPERLLATQFVLLDVKGSARVSFGAIPNVRALTGMTIYGQYLEIANASFLHSTAIAAQAATGCAVVAQGTVMAFNTTGRGGAIFRGVNVPPGCSWQLVGHTVVVPANGVTITGHTRAAGNATVHFDHTGIAVGTAVTIQLEVWCTCNGVVSQHFLFARGTK